ncbi:MAG: hypothetical protein GEU93_10145 [Propionibacteriales bacterium]|nr:hypothetical protein [Propionibacteriales bacterium]
MADLEDELRHALQQPPLPSGPTEDVEEVLARVHAGVRRRRRRRAVTATVMSVALITGGVWVFDLTPGAQSSTRTPQAADSATDRTSPPKPPEPTAVRKQRPPGAPEVLDRSGFDVWSMSAVNSSDVWVLGAVGCGKGTCVDLRSTTDAGTTWSEPERIDLENPPHPSTPTTYDVRFTGAGEHGWVYGDRIWSTHDGGRGWDPVTLPGGAGVQQLAAWGEEVYAVTDQGGLLRSTAGSDEWSPADAGLGVEPMSLAVSVDAVAVVGYDQDREPALSWSTNGDYWNQESTGCPDSTADARLSTTQGSLWLTCSSRSRSLVFVSEDLGGSWERIPGEFHPADQIAGRSPSHGVVAGPSYGVATIGRDIEPEPADAPKVERARFAGCTNDETCYVITQNGRLLRSGDSAQSWENLPIG